MRGEALRFKRCCFCLPLRSGLLGWGYLTLGLNFLKAILLTVLYVPHLVIYVPSITLVIIDATFSLVLIVACHKKSPKLFKIYFVYGIVIVVLLFASTSVMIFDEVQIAVRTWEIIRRNRQVGEVVLGLVATPALCFIDIFIYIYVLFLVRSERKKLQEENLEMQFINNEAEEAHRGEPV